MNNCCNKYCGYLDNNNLCHNCDHTEDCQCHKSRDALREELDILKKALKEYQDEIIQKNNALDAEKEYRNELIKTNTSLEVGLIIAYIIIAIFAGLLMLK